MMTNDEKSKELEGTIELPELQTIDYILKADKGIITSDKLSSMQVKLYQVISTYRGCKTIFLKQSTLAEKMSCSREWVNKQLVELAELGLLLVDKRIGTTNLYRFVTYAEWVKSQNLSLVKGYAAVPYFILFDKDLSSNELRFYEFLKSCIGYSQISPSISELEEYCCMSRKTVCTVKQSLKDKGLISCEGQGNTTVGLSFNVYKITDEYEWLNNKKKI